MLDKQVNNKIKQAVNQVVCCKAHTKTGLDRQNTDIGKTIELGNRLIKSGAEKESHT
jgi:hypothetical protein